MLVFVRLLLPSFVYALILNSVIPPIAPSILLILIVPPLIHSYRYSHSAVSVARHRNSYIMIVRKMMVTMMMRMI